MTNNAHASLPPAERINDHSRILDALRQAVREALLDHKRAGSPVAVWQNERVEWIQPEDIHVGVDAPPRPEGGALVEERGMKSRLPIPRDVLERFCRKHDIRRLALFGSVLEGTARADSDIDLLVEFEPGREPGLMALARMENELSQLLGGKRVDLRTAEDLSRYFREEVVRTAEVQYARG
jgi:uncharacterized protein